MQMKSYTIGQWADIWFMSYTGDLKQTTFDCYKYARKRINKICPELESKLLTDLSQLDFQIIINKMGERYAKSSIRHVIVLYSLLFSSACQNNICPVSPINKIKIPRGARVKEVIPLNDSEQEELKNSFNRLCLSETLLIEFFLLTGLRRNELINLMWSDWDRRRGFIGVIDSKSESGIRKIPAIKRIKEILYTLEVRNRIYRKSKYIFCNSKGNRMTESAVQNICNKASKISEIRHISPHMFRHTFATNCIKKGMNVSALSKIIGHSDIAFTMNTYVKPDDDYLVSEMEVLFNN